MNASYVVPLEAVSMGDVARVGGKNASLGELLRHLTRAGVRAVGGFATDVSAYAAFVAANRENPWSARALRARVRLADARDDRAEVRRLCARLAQVASTPRACR